jgi:hypothetical protein
MVTSFAYSDGTVVNAKEVNGVYTDGNVTATVSVDGANESESAYFNGTVQVGRPQAILTLNSLL